MQNGGEKWEGFFSPPNVGGVARSAGVVYK